MDMSTLRTPNLGSAGEKRKLSNSEPPRPRKRNATACRICRARKTKCDNKKPRCSYCESVGAACDDSVDEPVLLPPESQAILDRIDRLERKLLEASWRSDPTTQLSNASPAVASATPAARENDTLPTRKSLSYFTVESILSWPVFEDQYRSCLNLRDLMRTSGSGDAEYLSPQSSGKGLALMSFELESCSKLLDNFFNRVHIKNPVLDEKEIREWTRETSFNGIGWDARSCLVLLVCALGSISEQFPSEGSARLPGSFKDSEDYQLAEAWFAASQKRIGMLLSRGGGVLEAQCFFFSGVYLAHSFRPFAAWLLFLQAIACCQTFQHISKESLELSFPLPAFVEDRTGWRSEESMYWTCFKSELELRLELSLPGFNAADLSYPDFLPSPPLEPVQKQDQAWYFYLAEIALRRLANQILTQVLPYSNVSMICDLANIALMMPDFESQAEQWSQLLPPEVDIHTAGHDGDILRFILKGHLLNCYESMYWPFTVNAINFPANRNRSLDHFVRKEFQVCVNRIWVNEPGFHHRHHGTWGMMRSCTRSALVLVAAKNCGQLDALLPLGWDQAVQRVIALLDFWRGECGDAENRRDILEGAMTSLDQNCLL